MWPKTPAIQPGKPWRLAGTVRDEGPDAASRVITIPVATTPARPSPPSAVGAHPGTAPSTRGRPAPAPTAPVEASWPAKATRSAAARAAIRRSGMGRGLSVRDGTIRLRRSRAGEHRRSHAMADTTSSTERDRARSGPDGPQASSGGRAPSWTRVFVFGYLAAVLICGVFVIEAWPLTGFRLFSHLRYARQLGWQATTVDRSGRETIIHFGAFPPTYRHLPLIMRTYGGVPPARQGGSCPARAAPGRRPRGGGGGGGGASPPVVPP